ncbi:unnamed protein product [Microthlaspi erraticum]|uniref:Retrotransposon gag domain-containing protein n=1 Tax=Microthlaspi erraticum TaxID=1685480 RepID=A0A6D2I0G2_9BRAS|nr:unnamed protein product [Microthlaspi erraticum]
MDSHQSVPHAPQPQDLGPTPDQAQVVTPTIGTCDVPHCNGLSYGIHPPPIEAHAYEIKPSLIRLIQSSKFLGKGFENPYDHLNYFKRLCGTFRLAGVPEDSIKLLLFPFSLGEKASKWERAIPSHLVKSWDDCKRVFLLKFYPTQRTHQMRRNILNFQQDSHETFHEAWERLRGYTRDCPHHGFTREVILSHFYWGVAKEQKWTLDVASQGSLLNLTIEQGELLVEKLAKSEESYNESHDVTPRESSYEDSTWTALQDMLDRLEKLLNVQNRGVCLDLEQCQEEAKFMVKNGISNQERMLLNNWYNHGVQGIQQSYQQNHEPSQVSNNVAVEVNEEKIPFGFDGQIGEPQHEEEAKDVGTAQEYGLESIQWADEEESVLKEESVLEETQEDALAPKGKCLNSFFLPSLETKEIVSNFESKDLASHPKALKEVKNIKEKEEVKTKESKKPYEFHLTNHAPSSHTMSLHPLRHINGTIEYKVKCKGTSKPFSRVKAILHPKMLENNHCKLQELLSTILLVNLTKSTSLDSSTHLAISRSTRISATPSLQFPKDKG